MNENRNKFNALWSHITGACQHRASPLMLEVRDVIAACLAGEKMNARPAWDLGNRIADSSGCDFERYGTAFIVKVRGEWTITNADLLCWADLSFFGRRDYFPDHWNWLTSAISDAISKKRIWQTLERYKTTGGLTDDHRKLLAGLIWDMSLWRGDGVSLYVQGKRPFGNSSREHDMVEILGWDVKLDEDEDFPTDIVERCWEMFDELQFAIIDALAR